MRPVKRGRPYNREPKTGDRTKKHRYYSNVASQLGNDTYQW